MTRKIYGIPNSLLARIRTYQFDEAQRRQQTVHESDVVRQALEFGMTLMENEHKRDGEP
jgi:hypothetical protein